MKISLKASKPSTLEADALNIFLWEDILEKEINIFPDSLMADIRAAISQENFKGKKGEILVLSSKGQISSYKLILIGNGKKNEFTTSDIADQIAVSIKKAKENKAVKVVLIIPDEWYIKNSNPVRNIVESIYLCNYKYEKYKTPDNLKNDRSIEEVFLSLPANKISLGEDELLKGIELSKAVIYCRDLVNEAPQITTPTFLAEEAVAIGKNSKGIIKVNILEKEDVEKLGMNAFLGVSKGSDEPPKFIILKYKSNRPKKKIVIIGKGITFDSGGLSLKPASSMETMKLDMAGAAAILGIFSSLSALKPDVELVGLIPACENMPSGKALKPGDILKAYNGKSIEVVNTDAEGRLTLADTLSYAVDREKPDEIVDLATLTGACMVALGQDIAGLFGNDDTLLTALEKSARESGEEIWRLPLYKNYKELNKSHIADIKNAGSTRYAGAITAALFLQEFVGKTAWAHLDIAGPAFMEKDTPLIPYGGAGFGVRLMLQYLTSQ